MQIDIDLKEPLALALAQTAAQQRSEKSQRPLLDAQHHSQEHPSHVLAQFTPRSSGESSLSAVSPNELTAARVNLALGGGSSKASATRLTGIQTSLPISRLALERLGHVMSMNMKQALLQCQASKHNALPLLLLLFSVTLSLLSRSY